MTLVDSSVWINYFNGVETLSTTLLDERLTSDRIFIGDLILIEVLQGFRSEKNFNIALKLLSSFEYVNLTNQKLAIISAENYRIMRAKGITVRKTIKVIIATFCIEQKMLLLHDDKDFTPMEKHLGLEVLNGH